MRARPDGDDVCGVTRDILKLATQDRRNGCEYLRAP
jgi:hypothetical protein